MKISVENFKYFVRASMVWSNDKNLVLLKEVAAVGVLSHMVWGGKVLLIMSVLWVRQSL